jgi:uroporphyrinogen III methyltransferase/synthase
LGIKNLPEALQIACIGPKTAAALESKGYHADFVPDEYIAEAILPGLGDLEGLRVLLARADIARQDLPNAIRAGGGTADDISAYRTLPTEPEGAGLAEIAASTDVLTFTSPSTVENFFQIMLNEGLDPLHLPGNPVVACIGPITAKAAEDKGYQVAVIPENYTIEGLLDALIDYYWENVNE